MSFYSVGIRASKKLLLANGSVVGDFARWYLAYALDARKLKRLQVFGSLGDAGAGVGQDGHCAQLEAYQRTTRQSATDQLIEASRASATSSGFSWASRRACTWVSVPRNAAWIRPSVALLCTAADTMCVRIDADASQRKMPILAFSDPVLHCRRVICYKET